MLSRLLQAGLAQLETNSSAEAAAWLNKGLDRTATMRIALMLGQAYEGMTPKAAARHAVKVLSDNQTVHHFTQQQAQQLAAEVVQPALDAAAAAAARGKGGLVRLASLRQAAACVVCMGRADVSGPLLQAMLRLQLQLEPDPVGAALESSAGKSAVELLLVWGAGTRAVLDIQQLQATLGWLAETEGGGRLPDVCIAALLRNALLAALQSEELFQQPALSAACSRAIAARGGSSSSSIATRISFLKEVFHAAQQAAGQGASSLLRSEELKALVCFAEQHSSEANPNAGDLQQLLPGDTCAAMLQQLLTACQAAAAPTVLQHVLQQVSDEQLQQLPVSLLEQTAVQLLRAAPPQLVESGDAAELLLRVLAAAIQSIEDRFGAGELHASVQAVILLEAISGKSASPAGDPAELAAAATAALSNMMIEELQTPRKGTAGSKDTPNQGGASLVAGIFRQLQLESGSVAGKVPKGKAKQQSKQMMQQLEQGMNDMLARAAEAVPKGPPAVKLPFSQMLSWLQQLGRKQEQPAAAFAALLQQMLSHTLTFEVPRKQSWQLYQLLLELQQQPSWQQLGLTGLTAAACDALIQQQREPAWYGTGASNVLQLLQHASSSSSNSSDTAAQKQAVSSDVYAELSRSSQLLVLVALVRLGRHADVLQLLQQTQQGLQQLPTLISVWAAQQQQQQSQPGAAAEATMSFSDDEGEPQQLLQSASRLATRVRGTPVTLQVLQQALAVTLQDSQLQQSEQLVQLMQQVARSSSMPELFLDGQLEQYLLLLCQDSSSSSGFDTARQLVAASVSNSAAVQFSVPAVAKYAAGAAGTDEAKATTQHLLLQMADLPVLL
jgi:hypothetical protein